MADALDAISSTHAKDPVLTDSYLFTLARFGDTDALTQLWNRYYTLAYLAALGHATKKISASTIVTSSFDRWLERTEKRTHSDAFMADWFASIPAEAPTPLHRAVLWAFYALSPHDRTIVWRGVVDRWGDDQIDAALNLAPGEASPIPHGEEMFGRYLAMAASALHLPVDPPDFAPENWRTLLVTSVLGASTEVLDELGARIDSTDVITPPGAPQPTFTPTSHQVPIASVLKVAAIVVVAVALAVIGILGLTRWSRSDADQPQEVLSPAAEPSRTPTPTPSPTPSPTPTPEATPEESTEPETEPEDNNPAPNSQPTRTTANPAPPAPPAPEPNPAPPAPEPEPEPQPSTTEPTDTGGGDTGGDTGGDNTSYAEPTEDTDET